MLNIFCPPLPPSPSPSPSPLLLLLPLPLPLSLPSPSPPPPPPSPPFPPPPSSPSLTHLRVGSMSYGEGVHDIITASEFLWVKLSTAAFHHNILLHVHMYMCINQLCYATLASYVLLDSPLSFSHLLPPCLPAALPPYLFLPPSRPPALFLDTHTVYMYTPLVTQHTLWRAQ